MFRLQVLPTPPPRPALHGALVPVAWLLRRVSVGIAILAVWQRSLLRKRAKWTLEGGCRSCGRCCENLLMQEGAGHSWLRRFWHEQVFDFYPKENVFEGHRAYGCRNFSADRKCTKYSLRPFICRIYPALPLFERPTPKPHCGFRVVDD